MNPLPAWAATPEARALIGQAIANPPQRTITRGAWIEGGGNVRFHGGVTGKLRRLYSDWLDREFAALDAVYAVKGFWDQAASDALCRVEDADQLIERLLAEAERADLEPKELPDGRFQVAA